VVVYTAEAQGWRLENQWRILGYNVKQAVPPRVPTTRIVSRLVCIVNDKVQSWRCSTSNWARDMVLVVHRGLVWTTQVTLASRTDLRPQLLFHVVQALMLIISHFPFSQILFSVIRLDFCKQLFVSYDSHVRSRRWFLVWPTSMTHFRTSTPL